MKTDKKPKFPLRMAPMYMTLFMGNAAYQNNISNFLSAASLDEQIVGTLLALVPIVGMAGQTLFGAIGDKVPYKNTLLVILSCLSAGAMLLLGLGDALWLMASSLCLYAFFQMSMEPMLNTVTLETLEKTGFAFGPIRMVGTISFAVMSPIFGLLINDQYERLPYILFAILLLGAAGALFLPKVEGHARRGRRAPMKELMKNRQLMIMVGFTFVLATGMSFFYVFFPVLFVSEEVGGNSALLGIAFFVSSISEIPFLLSSDKMIGKLGAGRVLMIAACAMALRWITIFFLKNKYALLSTQVLHSFGYVVLSFVMAKYINQVMPMELKAGGQLLFTLVGLTASRAIGSLIGGVISRNFGIRNLFLIGFLMTIAALAIFAMLMHKDKALADAGKEMAREGA